VSLALGLLGVAASLSLFVSRADSKTLTVSDNTRELAERLANLEQRVEELETRLNTCESGAVVPKASKVSTEKAEEPHVMTTSANSTNCEVPFVIDHSGIIRVNPRCL
jgi:phage shock protein A